MLNTCPTAYPPPIETSCASPSDQEPPSKLNTT